MSKGNVIDKKKDLNATEELIREVSEGVIQRSRSGRHRRRGARMEAAPGSAANAAAPGNTSGAEMSQAAHHFQAEPGTPVAPTALAMPNAESASDSTTAVETPAPAHEAAAHHPHPHPSHPHEEPPVLLQPPPPAVLLPALPNGRKIALICHEDAESAIGRKAAGYADGLAARGHAVHVFARHALSTTQAGVKMHALGDAPQENLLERVHEFSRRVCGAFRQHLGNGNDGNDGNGGNAGAAALLGFEWAAIPSLLELASEQRASTKTGCKADASQAVLAEAPVLLSLDSLECQRSDMRSELSRRIEEIELGGLRHATRLQLHDQRTAREARRLAPECHERLAAIACPFPAGEFKGIADAGVVKARIQVGPIDPLVLFIGDLDERHGPDILMKSVVPVLKNHPQARFAFVGDGVLQWPLRVHARYLLLEHAVRFLGHIGGEALLELIQAADIVCVPSREQTEIWPIQAAWAARRPVAATHDAAGGLIRHEENGVLIYPSESSCVWGVERLLFSAELRQQLAENGRRTLDEKFGWGNAAAQLEELMALKSAAANRS